MEITSNAPFVDTSAADLGLSVTDRTRREALAELDAEGLALRVLGASHQVIAGEILTETLACAPDLPRVRLPHTEQLTPPGWAYALTIERITGTGAELAEQALTAVADLPHRLCVRFAGDPHALTVVAARRTDSGWAWETWHVYPQHHEAVRSRSTLEATA